MKVRLTKSVRDFGGSPYPKGSVLEARIGPDGKLKVVGAQHMPLGFNEWETVLTNEDLERLINR